MRRKGVTVRSTINLLIVVTALEHGLALLHDDQDFEQIAGHLCDLKVLNKF